MNSLVASLGSWTLKVRLLILIVIAAVLAVAFAFPKNPAKVAVEEDLTTTESPEKQKEIDLRRKTLWERPLPGREPAADPELDIQVEVDRSRGKNRLYFTISEKHGYYVETFDISVWFKKPGEKIDEDSRPTATMHVENFLKANDTLRVCMEVVPAELDKVGGDIGATQNWEARITNYGRVREKNPDPLPLLPDEVDRCN